MRRFLVSISLFVLSLSGMAQALEVSDSCASKYSVNISVHGMTITGLCIVRDYGDEVIGSVVNEFGIKAFDKLGELGFTFFLGASIPIYIIRCIEPDIMNWNCYVSCSTKFVLAVALSYVITRWCEKPLLAWGKGVEKSL